MPTFRRDHDVVAPAAPLEPAADHGLALAALMAGHPIRIAVGRVDGVAAVRDEGVEHANEVGSSAVQPNTLPPSRAA
jgi:hypothetical protein